MLNKYSVSKHLIIYLFFYIPEAYTTRTDKHLCSISLIQSTSMKGSHMAKN